MVSLTRTRSKVKRSKTTPAFVCLPKRLLQNPPIAHRGAPSTDLLTVFDCAVAAAIVALARQQLDTEKRSAGWSAGREALVATRRKLGPGSKDMNSYKLDGTNYEFKIAGMDGYRQGVKAFNNRAGGRAITVTCSKSALLRVAGLLQKGANYNRLDAALMRLKSAVRVDRENFPPLFSTGYRRLTNGSLRLYINAAWLPLIDFGLAPLPLPTHGANVLALFLFLCGTDQRPSTDIEDSRTTINAEKLWRLIGISFTRPAHAKRALDEALKLVNNHLEELNRDGRLTEARLPIEFDIQPVGDTRVHCKAIYTEEPEMAETEDHNCEAEAHEPSGEELADDRADDRDDRMEDGRLETDGPSDAEFRRWLALTLEEQQREIEQREIERSSQSSVAAVVAKLRSMS